MDITITKATEQDLLEIISLKQNIWNEIENKEWYEIRGTTESFLKRILHENGLILKAINPENKIIGFLIVEGYLREDSELVRKTHIQNRNEYIEMTNAGVSQNYRGLGLQRKMILKAEELMLKANDNIKFSIATVHPDNKASYNTLTNIGYKKITEKELYSGKRRYIVVKKLPQNIKKGGYDYANKN